MKKGFTLIELLAVIVILAIIAVIAVPIVLNIIDESKEKATLRSAEFYVKAAELSIAQSTLKDKNITDGEYDLKDGDICLNDACTDKLDVEVNGEVPTSGTITISNGKVAGLNIVLDNKTIVKNVDGTLGYKQPVCTNISGTSIQVGSQIKCGTYNFHAISSSTETITLLSDVNIVDNIQYYTYNYGYENAVESTDNVALALDDFENQLNELSLELIEIRNLTASELNSLGCTDNQCRTFDEERGPVAKENVPTWLWADDYNTGYKSLFFIGVPTGNGFETDGMYVDYLDGNGFINSGTYCLECGGDDPKAGVRPVIKISINDIK